MNRTSELPIRGMDCASCASVVRSALESVDGVTSADVRLAAEKAVVEWDDERTSRRRLADAVVSAGYAVPDGHGARGSAGSGGVPGVPGPDGGDGQPAAPSGDGAGRLADAERFTRRAFRLTGLVFGAVLVVVVLGEWAGLFDVAAEAVPFPPLSEPLGNGGGLLPVPVWVAVWAWLAPFSPFPVPWNRGPP